MRIGRQLLILFTLLIALVSLGLVLPPVLADHGDPDISFKPSLPTPTPLQPLISLKKAPSPTPTAAPTSNCTYPSYFWKSLPESWPAQTVLGNHPYTREEMMALFAAEEDHASGRVIRQLYTVFLNVLNGADITTVESTILEADGWLALNPPGSGLSEFNRLRGLTLAALLENYNTGIFGPGLCPDAPPDFEATETPVRSPAPVTGAASTASELPGEDRSPPAEASPAGEAPPTLPPPDESPLPPSPAQPSPPPPTQTPIPASPTETPEASLLIQLPFPILPTIRVPLPGLPSLP